jgi:HEAT repeat protein
MNQYKTSLIKVMWHLLIVNVLLSCAFSRVFAADENGAVAAMSVEAIVASVRSNNVATFEKVASDLYLERQRLCRELLSILKDAKSSNFQKCSAAYYLGEMRLPDAVSVLSTLVALRNESSYGIKTRLPVMTDYPVVEALIKIGKASTVGMISNLENSSDPLVCDLSARVIRKVEGFELARIIVQNAIAKQTDAAKKARLQAAMSLKYFADSQ